MNFLVSNPLVDRLDIYVIGNDVNVIIYLHKQPLKLTQTQLPEQLRKKATVYANT